MRGTGIRRGRLAWLVLAATALGCVSCARPDATITHSFLGVGHSIPAVIIGEDGATLWRYDAPASDGWVLPGGDILLALYPSAAHPRGAVVRLDRATNEALFTWEGRQQEISTALLLPGDRYLIAELGPEPRAVVVDAAGEVESSTPLACQTDNPHMQTRMLRLGPGGHYLAPHLFDYAVKEYEPVSGAVVRTIATDDRGRAANDWPFTAIRLPDGNTLIGCTHGDRVIEVDASGGIVWGLTNADLGEELIHDACGVQRLANGNTVITSYAASGPAVKIFEVTRDKRVVWRYAGMEAGFHNFQILTTGGRRLTGPPMR